MLKQLRVCANIRTEHVFYIRGIHDPQPKQL